MQFAIALPWWTLLLIAAAVCLVAWASYTGAIVGLPRRQRAVLIALRALTLLLLVACLLRPVRVMPPDSTSDVVVPVLVDVSRSMGLADGEGRTRLDQAQVLIDRELRPTLARRFVPELWTFGDALERSDEGAALSASARRSDLSGALRALLDRYRERKVAAVVVVSDGGDTGTQDAAAALDAAAAPIFAIGVGSPRVVSDLEVLDVSAGEMAVADSSVDISVAAVSRGAAAPFDLRVLENGRPIDLRRVVPAADGGPVRAVFAVSPARDAATLYTVEIPSAPGERVLENNRRSVLVEPAGRRHAVLMIEGAPGFEHSFIKRALSADPGLEVDSVVRKGRDTTGAATYFVQAAAARAPRLASGFPQEREALYEYDAVILANVEADALSRAQLQMIADFVDIRGGGLLVLGAKSFVQQGFAGTPLEAVLPLRLTDRGGGVVRVSTRQDTRYAVTLTAEGAAHPVMRVGAGGADKWSSLPPLSGAAALGTLRPGAQSLALVRTPDGARPLVAVQRYGQGRSMVFTGEASWRWRMQMPAADRTYELFWRQAVRWVGAGAPNRLSIAAPLGLVPGSTAGIGVDVRDRTYAPVADAEVSLTVTLPGGAVTVLRAAATDPQSGRYGADMRFDEPGVYRLTASTQERQSRATNVDRWLLVGGADLEMADPRLNEQVLQRIATASGGQYLPADRIFELSSLLRSVEPEPSAPQLQELWHNAWIFAAVMMLLSAEWVLRRRWGLR